MCAQDASKVMLLSPGTTWEPACEPTPKPSVIPLLQEDIDRAVRLLPEALATMLTRSQFAGVFIAGGWLRASVAREAQTTDVDLFCFDQHNDLRYYLSMMGKITSDSDGSTTFDIAGTAVQIIRGWRFKEPHEALAAFDFTICQSAIWYQHDSAKWCGQCAPRFYADLAARRLHYLGPNGGAAVHRSLFRALKYIRRGYHISEPTLAELAGDALEAAGSAAALINVAHAVEYA